MIPANRDKLAKRVVRAAEAAPEKQNYVSPIDVLLGIGWLEPNSEKRWRQGQINYLERAVQANLNKITASMKEFRRWANAKGLLPRETHYVSKTRGRQTLRFSISGNPSIDQAYRTHWISPALSEKKRARLAEKTGRPPELVVVMPLNQDWKCHCCGDTGSLPGNGKSGSRLHEMYGDG